MPLNSNSTDKMNYIAKHPETGEFYLIGIFMRIDGRYGLQTLYLYKDGSPRVRSEEYWFETKKAASSRAEICCAPRGA